MAKKRCSCASLCDENGRCMAEPSCDDFRKPHVRIRRVQNAARRKAQMAVSVKMKEVSSNDEGEKRFGARRGLGP